MTSIPCATRSLVFIAGVAVAALPGQAQELSTNIEYKFVNARLGANGTLEITASKASSEHDFDFLTGKWTMHNKRLKERLKNSHEWAEYESTSDNFGPILNGIGNMDIYRTMYGAVGGKPYEGLTVRLFDPKTRLWSLYWVASDKGVMDPPVVGSFEGNIGYFYTRDTYNGMPIIMAFRWDRTDSDNPIWSQAFSTDNGKTWEVNMTNISHRAR
jgi:hypothetical protein